MFPINYPPTPKCLSFRSSVSRLRTTPRALTSHTSLRSPSSVLSNYRRASAPECAYPPLSLINSRPRVEVDLRWLRDLVRPLLYPLMNTSDQHTAETSTIKNSTLSSSVLSRLASTSSNSRPTLPTCRAFPTARSSVSQSFCSAAAMMSASSCVSDTM